MRTTTTDETDAPTDNENTAAAGEETSLAAELPDKIYNGEEVRFLTVLHTGYDWYTSHEIYAEGMNGQLINDAVFHRNTVVEMLLDIKIAETKGTNCSSIVRSSVSVADDRFDVVMPYMNDTINLALEGSLLDLKEIPYLDLEKH